ncbi:alkaline phosphatase D family protein [bacterium]|nr:alkaline phosphatase D family protein [bacterium]
MRANPLPKFCNHEIVSAKDALMVKILLSAAFVLIVVLRCSVLSAQHDNSRDAVRHISDEKYGQIAKTLKGKKPYGGQAEITYVEMLSLLKQNETKPAFDKALEAIELGLPFERLLVGPREELSKLHQFPRFQKWKSELKPSKMIHGPMLGKVTCSSASFWVRTDGEVKVRLTVGEGTAVSDEQMTRQETDFTAVLQVDGLLPETSYHYRLLIDGDSVAEGHFKTFAKSGTGSQFSVGFGGGAGYVVEWERMWDTILKVQPNAFLMMGDNVYIDQPESQLTQKYCYYRRQSRPEWKRFVSNTPIYSIWDDHDFGTNDCVPGPKIGKPAWKPKVWETFTQNWVNPAYGGGKDQPGCWYEFHMGDVHFIMLDGRYYRDLKGGTMLGPVQKKWVLETLKKSQATFKVLASPVPFTSGVKPGSRDPWDGYPAEREEIFSFIESNKIEGVFLIAADRHRTDLRVNTRPNGYDLYELESSRLTNHHTHGVVKTEGMVWGYNEKCSFAFMKFDTTTDDPQVEFQCITIDGEIKESSVLKRSQLTFD